MREAPLSLADQHRTHELQWRIDVDPTPAPCVEALKNGGIGDWPQ